MLAAVPPNPDNRVRHYATVEEITMGGPVQSIRKRWYSLLASPERARREWADTRWREDEDGSRVVACRDCPKFSADPPACSVPFGSPLRKCVVASMEAHLHDGRGKDALEIGFGRFALGRNLLRRSGGTWTGIDPFGPESPAPKIGKRLFGHAADIPFPDGTFDLVFGIQTLEHWGQPLPHLGLKGSDYGACVQEVWRVLKPGGAIYLDAPIHLHGTEMFVMGDLPRIRALFDDALWSDVVLERWREDHEPLPPYPPGPNLYPAWEREVHSYDPEAVARVKQKSIWLLAITARKRG